MGARSYYAEVLAAGQEVGHKIAICGCLDGLAALAMKQGEVVRAAELAGAAEALRESVGSKMEPADRLFRNAYISDLRAALSEEKFAAAYEQGCALKTDEAIALALQEPAHG